MLERNKFFAMLFGAKFDEEEDGSTEADTERPTSMPFSQSGNRTLFQSPSVYKHLSKKQRDDLTRSMMGLHRQTMSKAPGMGKG